MDSTKEEHIVELKEVESSEMCGDITDVVEDHEQESGTVVEKAANDVPANDSQKTQNHNLDFDSTKEEHIVELKEVESSEKCGDITKVVEDGEQGIETVVEMVAMVANGVPANDSQKTRRRTYPFKVLVSGLPLNARVEDIICYFSQFGEVLKTFIEGRHKANIIFSNDEPVKKAVFCSDPYFDDHKLLIRSINEVTAVITGIPTSLPVIEAEKLIKNTMQDAGVPVCRVFLPLRDSSDENEQRLLQGHAFVVFCDVQTLQKAEEKQKLEPFMVADSSVVLLSSVNQFYKQFCVRVFSLPLEHRRITVCQSVHTTLSEVGEIVALTCSCVPNSSAYAIYVLYASEEAVKKALEMEEVKVLDEFVEIQEFHQFEPGQGFQHLWLKVQNLPQRVTVTEIKHHFKHDKGIRNIELDMDLGSCFIQVDSEYAIQRCLEMHQTYLRGKCINILIAHEHPELSNFRSRRHGRNRANYSGNNNRNTKKNFRGGSKGFGSSNGQSSGKQEQNGFERRDGKFSRSKSSPSEKFEDIQNHSRADSTAVQAMVHQETSMY